MPNWEELKSLLQKCIDSTSGTNTNINQESGDALKLSTLEHAENIVEIIGLLVKEVEKLNRRVELIEKKLNEFSTDKNRNLEKECFTEEKISSENRGTPSLEEVRNSLRTLKEQVKLLKSKYLSED